MFSKIRLLNVSFGLMLAVFAPLTGQAQTPLLVTQISPVPSSAISSGNGMVVVTWTGGTAPFQVQTCSEPGGGTWQDVAGITSDSSQTNIPTGPTAFYRVVSVAANYSKRTDTTAPSTPTGLTATAASPSQINLSWNASTDSGPHATGVKGYNVCRNGVFLTQVLAPATSTVDTYGLTAQTRYSYAVSAIDNAYNQSAQSSLVWVTTSANGTCTYTISTSSSPTAGGSTSGGGNVNCSSSVTVTATASAGYSFVNWTESGTVVSTSATYTFAANANRNLVANFAAVSCTYSITTGSSPAAGGSTGGGGTVNCGSSVTVTASANAGYSFVSWTENGTVVSTSASYTFTANANRDLVANFTASPISYTISTSSSPSTGGTTGGGGTFNSGSSVTVTAAPASCYSFVNWTENGTAVSTSASYTFTASANRNLVANFAVIPYGIGTSSSPSAGGSTSGGGTVNCGSSVNVTATPSAGYAFVNWTESGTVVSTSANYNFTVSGNRALVANFTTVGDTAPPSVSLMAPTSGSTVSGTITVSASASDNVGVAKVEFYRDTMLVGTTTASPYSVPDDTTRLANGSHSYSAKAYDAAGNSTASAASTVTVSNQITSPPTGTCMWEQHFGGSLLSADGVIAGPVTEDRSGNVITVGAFKGTVNFGGGNVTSAGGKDIFILKYDNSGVYQWVRHIGSTANDRATGVAVDSSNNIVVVGSFSGTVDFGAGPLTSTDSSDVFVAKFAPNGVLLWVEHFGGSICTALALDAANNILITGCGSAANFGGAASSGAFVVKFSTNGNFVWAVGSGGTQGNAIAVDGNMDVVVAGVFLGSATFGTTTLTSAGGYDGFVAKYSGVTGANIWARGGGGAGNDYINGVAVDASGNVVVTGQFSGTASFGGAPLVATYSSGVLVAKYSASGAYLWSRGFSAVSYTGSGAGNAVAVDSLGNLVVSGVVAGGVGFDGVYLGAGSLDILLAKFSGIDCATIWAKSFGGLQSDSGFAVAVGASNNILTSGTFAVSADFGCGLMQSLAASDMSGDGFVVKLTP